MPSLSNLPTAANDLILDRLSPKALLHYGATSKDTNSIYKEYMRHKFNIQARLLVFFALHEIPIFRFFQSIYGIVISGSFAVQFFARVVYENSDLDLYVEYQHGYKLCVWLTDIGFTCTSSSDFTRQYYTGKQDLDDGEAALYYGELGHIFTALTFMRSQKKVQVIVTKDTIMGVITDFHSTCVINAITHKRAYAIFPLNTFEKFHTAEIYSLEGRGRQAIQKYVARGWTVVPRLQGGLEMASRIRRVGDRGCWTIRLRKSPETPCTLTLNSWKRIDFLTGEFTLSGRRFTHSDLHHSYMLASNPVEEFMVKVLTRLRNEQDKSHIGPLDTLLKKINDKRLNIHD